MQLLTTLQHRPYVFAFLVAFLAIGILNRGLTRTLLLLVIGYTIAFLSEFSSIRNGFPYGLYHYVYENLRGELLLGGVPVWDSLSYAFIAYASLETAAFFRLRHPILVAAILMTLLDVIIDPLAVRGNRWFLGRIFFYPEPGLYFGVPLTNFFGWFLVALAIFSLYRLAEIRFNLPPPPLRAPWLGAAFYASIALFNLAITFWIGEWVLGAVGAGVGLALLVIARINRKNVDRLFN